MRRFVVAGLVPCDPADLAGHLVDAGRAARIWPGAVDADAAEEPADASNRGAEEQVESVVVVRYGRASKDDAAPEVIASGPAPGEWSLHRFLPAQGGCLWTVESHADPLPGEPWMAFVRRRRRSRATVEAMVDAAAGYFASQR